MAKPKQLAKPKQSKQKAKQSNINSGTTRVTLGKVKMTLGIYALSIALCIFLTIHDVDYWLVFTTLYIIPPVSLLYLLYLFRPKTDALGLTLWFILGAVVIAIISCVAVFFAFMLSFGRS